MLIIKGQHFTTDDLVQSTDIKTELQIRYRNLKVNYNINRKTSYILKGELLMLS